MLNPSPTKVTSRPERPMLGISAMLLSVVLFSIMDILVKWLTSDYPVWQVMFFRSAVAMVPIAIFIARAGGVSILRTQRPWMHVARSFFGVGAMGCAFFGIANMPLAEAQAIFHSAPLLMTALSVPLLKEKVGVRRWLAVVVGFIGMLLIVKPGASRLGSDTATLGAIVMMCAALFGAFSGNIVRLLAKTDDPASITFYFTLTATVASGIVSFYYGWVTPTFVDTLLLIAIGILGGCGQYFLSLSLQNAEVGLVTPLRYLMIVIGGFLGYLIWQEIPDLFSLIGILIIVASGIYTMHREARLSRADKQQDFPARNTEYFTTDCCVISAIVTINICKISVMTTSIKDDDYYQKTDTFEKYRLICSQLFALLFIFLLITTDSRWKETLPAVEDILYGLGVICVGVAALGRMWCTLYIAGYKDNTLVTEGPYSLCRNPLYFFSMVGTFGVGFATETLSLTILLAVFFCIYYPFVIKAEESNLRRYFPDQFDQYSTATPAFWPNFKSYLEPEKYQVSPKIFRKSLFSAMWFIWVIAILRFTEVALESFGIEKLFSFY